MRKEDYYDRWEKAKCEIEWLGLQERAVLYESWLKVHRGTQNRGARNLVKQAKQINQYILDNSHIDENGYVVRNDGILSRSDEILKHLRTKSSAIKDALTPDADGHKTIDADKPSAFVGEKIISDKQRTSSVKLIEEAADSTKPAKVRLKAVDAALQAALSESLPQGWSGEISYSSKTDTYAELNLAEPKNMAKALDNAAKRVLGADVRFDNPLN